MTTKQMSELREGDRVTHMGAKAFTEPLTVTEITRYNGSIVLVKLHGGRFWPMQPGTAERTQVTVLS